ncbi:MAG: hypothetical protein KDB01_22305, partial [Planctomycetaceae bacterium]|nr:hypothetical protein [Planctomycetaceae bacterium]
MKVGISYFFPTEIQNRRALSHRDPQKQTQIAEITIWRRGACGYNPPLRIATVSEDRLLLCHSIGKIVDGSRNCRPA